MDRSTAVLIVRSEHASVFRKRLGSDAAVAVFADAESLHAADAILTRPPKLVVLDSTFATTPRAATLVSRIKSEARSQPIELRVLIDDESHVPLLLSQNVTSPEKALVDTSRPLDRAGTRRAVRYGMNRLPVVVNGESGHLVDLSVTGAQLMVTIRLRPGQAVRVTLAEDASNIRCQGTVAWSVAATIGSSIQYRGGVEFQNPDTTRLSAFCTRFGAADRTFSP